jgi:tRNA (Thr-GGU) A37 N-methylase
LENSNKAEVRINKSNLLLLADYTANSMARIMITLNPIGFVRSSRTELLDDNWDSVASQIELTPEFGTDALDGLDEFSHAEVILYFHRVPESAIERGARYPRGNKAWPRVGIFA